MSDDFPVLPDPERKEYKQSVRNCPLLEGNRGKAWVACCTRRFLPLARRLAGDDPLAEDVLQESWIRILEAVRPTRLGGSKACPWVRTIIANTVRDVLRKRQHLGEEPLREVADPTPDPEALAWKREQLDLIKKAIRQLPDIYGQVLELRLKGLPNPEIARRLHLSRSNVAIRLHRGVRLLGRRLDSRLQSSPLAGSRVNSSGSERSAEKSEESL